LGGIPPIAALLRAAGGMTGLGLTPALRSPVEKILGGFGLLKLVFLGTEEKFS